LDGNPGTGEGIVGKWLTCLVIAVEYNHRLGIEYEVGKVKERKNIICSRL